MRQGSWRCVGGFSASPLQVGLWGKVCFVPGGTSSVLFRQYLQQWVCFAQAGRLRLFPLGCINPNKTEAAKRSAFLALTWWLVTSIPSWRGATESPSFRFLDPGWFYFVSVSLIVICWSNDVAWNRHSLWVVSGLYSHLLKQNCAPMSLDQMCLNMIISRYNEYDFKT